MHDKYFYEAAELALIDTDVRRTFATGIAGFSHVVDSICAIKYAKVNIEQIKYLSDNQAEVTLNIVIPSIEKMDGKKYEERLSEAFKKKVGYSVEEIKNRDLTKSEIEKLIPVYMKITGEEIEKINHFTSLNETVKVNKNSNSQWEIEKLGLF